VSATAADTQRFADLSAALRLASPTVRALLVLGARVGDLAANPWGSVEASWAPGAAIRVEAAAGRYPPDLTGFAEGYYAQAGIRVYARGSPRERRPPGLEVGPERDGAVRLRVRLAQAASAAAIAGDWNAWDPVPMRPEGDLWVVDLRLAPGLYHYAILADGIWTLPRDVAALDDELGGKVGVFVISPRR
jgi:hypothetical protein